MVRINFLNLSIQKLSLIGLLVSMSMQGLNAQNVYVDDLGVMRWENTKEEIHGFGVNYSVPFAHAYRTAKRLNIDPKQAIDNDVYHFTRLGFDLYRLHVWDTQISDVEGNLIENEYLDTFDYLLNKLKENNIYYVITPIAFWGDGWPEPDTATPGFSHKYGKADCLTNPDAIEAQQNYLYQFLNHVNPYTDVAYKDEPNIIAFEVSNEPHHRGEGADVKSFVEVMVNAMRKTGTKKPIFYNMSHGVHFVDDYFEGGADGGTFQWYPTGLGYQKELSGNLLPNVDDYDIPFNESFKKYKGAKLVYEFDAADVGRSYIYPAMARSFRESGIQIATHFAYDPTYMADVNTEYNTHYMNLAYTPQKALSLKICAEVFREIPMYTDFGNYPSNSSFGNFKVDYEMDLAEYNSDEKFFYTNSTFSKPINEDRLKEIAGFGVSNLVVYEGKGAYFMDKLSDGVWRLEVMPDALWVDNPFGRNSPDKIIGVINWKSHSITLNLNNLGKEFEIKGINEGNDLQNETITGRFRVSPGTYIISKKGIQVKGPKYRVFKTHNLNAFFAPKSNVTKRYLKHQPLLEASEGKEIKIKVQYINTLQPEKIEIVGYNNRSRFRKELVEVEPYQYEVLLESETITEGYLQYNFIVTQNDKETITYPADKNGKPTDWDFFARETYRVPIVKTTKSIELFNALKDAEDIVRPWRRGITLMPTALSNEAEYQIKLDQLYYPDNENLNAEPIYDYSLKHFVHEEITGRKEDLNTKKYLTVKGRSLKDELSTVKIALVLKNGSSYGGSFNLTKNIAIHKLALSDLKLAKTVTLPRPYPSFLPYYFEHNNTDTFNINNVESLQISFQPDPKLDNKNQSVAVGIIFISLE